jgi:hypothetical protein
VKHVVLKAIVMAGLAVSLAAAYSPAANAVVAGAMKGGDLTYGGGSQKGVMTCSAAAALCKRNFPASTADCASAGATCKQTGVFTNPQGRSFSGMIKR